MERNVIRDSAGIPASMAMTSVYETLLRSNIIVINGEITDEMADTVVAQILCLNAKNPNVPITFYINSPGGSVTAGMAIYDMMHYVANPIVTTGTGLCASMAAVLLSSGDAGRRYATPNAKIMIHQPSTGVNYSNVTDLQIVANEAEKTKKLLTDLLLENSHKKPDNGKAGYDPETKKELSREKLANMLEHDTYLTAEEALTYGFIDGIADTANHMIRREDLTQRRPAPARRPAAPAPKPAPKKPML